MRKIGLVQCCSTALDMFKFSTDAIYNNAGIEDRDWIYYVVLWNPSKEVDDYAHSLLHGSHINAAILYHTTNEDVGFVPNLREMMNVGFREAAKECEYFGLVNTDMYFGKDWLLNLSKYATPDTIVNSTHITPIYGPHVITANLGIPTYKTFNMQEFNRLYDLHYEDKLTTEHTRGGWKATNTMPYLIPSRIWNEVGPWELTIDGGDTPDRRFFQRAHDYGMEFTMSHSSIVYHHEAVERKTGRIPEGMVYES